LSNNSRSLDLRLQKYYFFPNEPNIFCIFHQKKIQYAVNQ